MVYFLRPIVQLNIPVPLGMNILTEFSCWVTIFFFQVLDVLAHCHVGSCFPNISEETLVLRNVSEQKGLTEYLESASCMVPKILVFEYLG